MSRIKEGDLVIVTENSNLNLSGDFEIFDIIHKGTVAVVVNITPDKSQTLIKNGYSNYWIKTLLLRKTSKFK